MATKTTTKKTAKTTSAKKAPNKAVAKKTSSKIATKKAPAKKSVTKKTTKTTAKKASPKKAVSKKRAKNEEETTLHPVRSLLQAMDHRAFWVSDGQVLHNLQMLADALSEMESDTYKYHAAGESNDFAEWVDQVLCDGDCAGNLASASTPKKAHTVVVRHLKYYAL